MAKLVIDSVSAKTLPVLDGLYFSDQDKFDSVIASTSGDALRRLFRASVARQEVLGRALLQEQDAAKLLEILIHNNLFSREGDNNEQEFEQVMDNLNDSVLRHLFKMSVIRFVLLHGA